MIFLSRLFLFPILQKTMICTVLPRPGSSICPGSGGSRHSGPDHPILRDQYPPWRSRNPLRLRSPGFLKYLKDLFSGLPPGFLIHREGFDRNMRHFSSFLRDPSSVFYNHNRNSPAFEIKKLLHLKGILFLIHSGRAVPALV